MERKKGYLIIDVLQRLEKNIENIGGFCEGWYTDGSTEYLFKLETGLMAYNELFYSALLRKIDLNAVEYDLAVKNKQKGVITPNYKSKMVSSFTVYDIFETAITKKEKSKHNYYDLEKSKK